MLVVKLQVWQLIVELDATSIFVRVPFVGQLYLSTHTVAWDGWSQLRGVS